MKLGVLVLEFIGDLALAYGCLLVIRGSGFGNFPAILRRLPFLWNLGMSGKIRIRV